MNTTQAKLILPIPPSVNHAYINRRLNGSRGRFLSDEAKNWKTQVGYIAKAEIRQQNWQMPPKDTKIVLEVTAFWGDGRRHDMNNIHKLLCDALEGYFYLDDCKVLVRDMDFAVDRKFPRVECTLYPVDEVAL